MSNTFTKSDETVMGSWRVMAGTLAMDDSNSGDAAGTGLNRVIQVVGTSSQMARLTHSASSIAACTALSGASYQVVVFGV
jgi:hypothetical protein